MASMNSQPQSGLWTVSVTTVVAGVGVGGLPLSEEAATPSLAIHSL